MRILAIETSGTSFSIALAEDNRLILEKFWQSGLKHSERVVPVIKGMLKKARWKINSIEKIAVSTGPGSFTGIRVGLSCAKTIAQALNIPLVGISTLEILKNAVPEGDYKIVPAIDALRGEVFVKYENGKIEIMPNEKYWDELNKNKSRVYVVGNAAVNYRENIKKYLDKKIIFGKLLSNFPRAKVLASLADNKKGSAWNKVDPLYIRRSWAEERR